MNLGTVEYEPLQAIQTCESVWTDEIDVTVVEGKPPEVSETPERVVRDKVEPGHRELYPVRVAGYLVEIIQVAVSANVGGRPFVIQNRR